MQNGYDDFLKSLSVVTDRREEENAMIRTIIQTIVFETVLFILVKII